MYVGIMMKTQFSKRGAFCLFNSGKAAIIFVDLQRNYTRLKGNALSLQRNLLCIPSKKCCREARRNSDVLSKPKCAAIGFPYLSENVLQSAFRRIKFLISHQQSAISAYRRNSFLIFQPKYAVISLQKEQVSSILTKICCNHSLEGINFSYLSKNVL